ncbi:hypothetical protein Pmani_019220 [Petrolisthes manimaculis]|uniref:Uncharacterized protein n=1 Tax=Petrolisthes manimaculis TaxID=1843537 RepID=A0AAE1PIK4_9EUCA|nr:hypothetical protein Pmani_019220 [Petrolisthes manimaculis]
MASSVNVRLLRWVLLVVLLSISQPALGQNPGNILDFTPSQPCSSQNPQCTNKLDLTADDEAELTIEDEQTINNQQQQQQQQKEEYEGVDPYDAENIRQVLSCVFNSVPIIGGDWLGVVARLVFSDAELLEGAHSFVAGGRLLARIVDVRGSYQATRHIRFLESCLELEEYPDDTQQHSEGYDNNNVIDKENNISQSRGSKVQKLSSTISHRRKKRTLQVNSSGHGTDSLVGFNLLGLLVVGALITYLVYLLTM